MPRQLHTLILEESEVDAQRLRDELRRAHYEVICERVDTPAAFAAALESHSWDVILSDYATPHLSAVTALSILKDCGLDIPFIVVSSMADLDAAVEVMKAGAHDFFTHDNLSRLVPAVERELLQAHQRRQDRQGQEDAELRYRALFERSSDAVFWFSLDRVILKVNEQAAQMMGYSPEEMLGKHISELIIPRDYPDAFRIHNLLLAGHTPPLYERMIVRKDGTELPVEINITAVLDSSGKPLYMQSIVRDISERKRAQEALAGEHNLLQTVIETLPDQIYVKDLDHRFLLVNSAMARLHQLSSIDDIVGKTDTDLFGAVAAEDIAAEDQLFASGIPIVNQERFTPLQWGGPRWSLVTKIPLRDSAGNIIGLVGINRDISERKHAEAALTQERTLLRTLIDHLPHYIFIKDTQDRFVDCNLACAHLLGVESPTELVGKTDFDFFPHDLATQYYADDMRVIRDGEPVIDLEEVTLDETGKPIWVSVTKLPLFDSDGQIVGLVGMGINITERKRVQAQRLALDVEQERAKALRRFLADASHDLRTPISVMKTNLYLLQKQLDSDKLLRHVNILALHTDRIHRMLEDMFTLSALDLGTAEFRFEVCDVNSLAREAYARFQSAAAQHTFQIDQSAQRADVIAEAAQLIRAVGCLLENALHYTPSGGTIVLRTRNDERQVVIEVCDSGIGIQPDDLPNIFNRFYRTDKARGSDHGGSGLGLPIARKIVEAHGGHIEVESAPGTGSTFKVFLPLTPQP
jgi:PAS domain S-box-containing protein